MGLGMPARLWSPVLDRLVARGLVARTVDHRGAGEAAALPPRDDLADMAADVIAHLDAAGTPRVHLVGISMGGMVAQEVALRRPDRVSSLALVATAASGWSVVSPPSGEALRALLFSKDRSERLARLLFPPAVRTQPETAARVASMVKGAAPATTVRAHLRAASRHDARRRLATLRMPVLVVKPALDALIPPRCSDELARCVPSARLETLGTAGHGLIAQHPDLLAALFADHAARAEAR